MDKDTGEKSCLHVMAILSYADDVALEKLRQHLERQGRTATKTDLLHEAVQLLVSKYGA